MEKQIIISVHNYKTAGSTFHSVIDRQFKRTEIINANLIGIENTTQLLTASTDAFKQQIKIIHGHFPFGWHKYFSQKHTYISFLRNPIDRVVSDYYYNKKFNLGHNYPYASRMSLEEYLMCDEILNVDNGQTRFIAGDMETKYGDNSLFMLDKAIQNIYTHFSFVGLTERFDESLLLANHTLSWNKLYYKSQNITEKKNTKLDNKVLELIQERNQLDVQLYNHVASNFDAALQQIPFANGRMILQNASKRLYNTIHPLYKKIIKH
jgi:hypothetical protein